MQLIEELKGLGCHQQDIGDALDAADPDWLEHLAATADSQGMAEAHAKLQTVESN